MTFRCGRSAWPWPAQRGPRGVVPMSIFCANCGGGIGVKRGLRACVMMAALASPSKAFLPTLPTLLRQSRNALRTSALQNPASSARPRRALTSLSAADNNSSNSARDAAMAAVRAAEDELGRQVDDLGDAAAGADDVREAVAAARAAARGAMDSLRRGGAGFPGGAAAAEGPRDVFASTTDVTSPARAAVEAALSAVAGAETTPPTESFSAARDAIDMAQAALGRRDSAAAELKQGVAATGSDSGDGGAAWRAVDADGTEGMASAAGAGVGVDNGDGGGSGGGLSEEGEGGGQEEEPTREPDSARTTRNNPAASHSHLSHLLWRQVAGPGDTVVDCTAGNGYDTLELAKIVALNDGQGKIYAMDVQDRALDATRARLDAELGQTAVKRVKLTKGNFRQLPAELGPMSVQLMVYNLGWLPGGDKSITTELEDTLESIEAAKRLMKSGGMISVMLYRGHAEGERETEAVLEYARGLTHYHWRVYVHERVNRPGSPVLLTIYRL